jgi:hypothetical protein
MNWTVEEYPILEFESFETADLLPLLAALEPYVRNMAIDTNSMWFKQLLADVIGRFTDVDLDELLEEQSPLPIAQPTYKESTTDKPQVILDKTNDKLKKDVASETDNTTK